MMNLGEQQQLEQDEWLLTLPNNLVDDMNET